MPSVARAASFRANVPQPSPRAHRGSNRGHAPRAAGPWKTILALLLISSPAICQTDPGLAPNGGFEELTNDGWVVGWERITDTADSEVETSTRAGNTAIRLTGKTKASRAGLKATLLPSDAAPTLRIQLAYRGNKGARAIIVRQAGAAEDDPTAEQRIDLDPTPQWRPGAGTVDVAALATGATGPLEIILIHEGPGETWFDGINVRPDRPLAPPAQPPAPTQAKVGPYATHWHPADGGHSNTNPPRLRWPARPRVTYTLELSPTPDFPPQTTERAEDLKLNYFIPWEPLAAGTWYWRVTSTTTRAPGVPETGNVPLDEAEGEPEVEDQPEPPDAPVDQPEDPVEETPETVPEPDAQELVSQATPEGGGEAPGGDEDEVAPAIPVGVDGTPITPPSMDEFFGRDALATGGEGLHAPIQEQTISPTRTFRIDGSAPVVTAMPTESLVAVLPEHPRVWLSLDALLSIRTIIAGQMKPEWDRFIARLDNLKGGDLAAEPEGRGKWRKASSKQLAANETILATAATESALVRDFAFAARVMSDQSYADEARRRALHLAEWDPEGSTGYVSHDQAFREILMAMALAVDWVGDDLTEEDRPKLLQAITTRGDALLAALSESRRPLHAFPYSSHGQTAVGVLTVVGIAVASDIPEATKWLEYSYPTAVTLFSPWAGDDGGWMQGETYWKRSAPFTFQLFDALKTAFGTDLYKLPWAGNTAKYKTYMHPPYRSRGGFGDGPEMPPDVNDRLAMVRLASATQDSLAAWYAEAITGEDEPNAFHFLWRDPGVKPTSPGDLPPSAQFPDSGLFAMHSSLTDPNGVHLYGRASAFGSFNHAHADQGHFSLDAFGQPLLIDAGYYDWYRSPHGTSFSRTSLAHNVALINDRIGQRAGDITAAGEIEAFVTSEHADYARVSIADAYPKGILKSYRRHFVYLRPDWLVVWDRIVGHENISATWLLHSLDEPEIDDATSTMLVRRGEAAAAIGAFGPEKLQWKSTSKFAKNPSFPEDDIDAPSQWHVLVKSQASVQSEDLLMLIAPYQGADPPTMSGLEAEGGTAAEATRGDSRLLALVRGAAPAPVVDEAPPRPRAGGRDKPKGRKRPADAPTDDTPEATPEDAPAGADPTATPDALIDAATEPSPAPSPEAPTPAAPHVVSGGGFTSESDLVVLGLSSDGGVAQLFATGLNSLAQGDAAVLTSTSPAEISARFGDTPSIIVTLAERAQITVGFPAQPAVIEIDGEETGAVWADGILTIDLQPGRHEIKLTP